MNGLFSSFPEHIHSFQYHNTKLISKTWKSQFLYKYLNNMLFQHLYVSNVPTSVKSNAGTRQQQQLPMKQQRKYVYLSVYPLKYARETVQSCSFWIFRRSTCRIEFSGQFAFVEKMYKLSEFH